MSFLTRFAFTFLLCASIVLSKPTGKTILLEQVSGDSLYKHIEQLSTAGGYFSRVNYTPGNRFAVEYLTAYFRHLPGIDSVAVDSFYINTATPPYNQKSVYNVSAFIFGSNGQNSFVICGGHYDASASHENNYNTNWNSLQAPGADDNASGIAAMMEIARILAAPENDLSFKRTIKFMAFGGEEYHPMHSNVHHAGSLWDADRTKKEHLPLNGALILDMIGYNPTTNYCEVISDGQSRWITEIVYQNREQFVPDLAMNNAPIDVPYSDHKSYQDYGFPAILLMENDRPWNNDFPNYTSNPFYHSQADTIGTLNFTQIEKVTKVALGTLFDLAIPDSATGVFTKSVPIVQNFELKTHPNPFNARVTISFLARKNPISLTIYDSRGRLVASLIHQQTLTSGWHRLQWNAQNKSSGLYFLKLNQGGQQISRKLILLK